MSLSQLNGTRSLNYGGSSTPGLPRGSLQTRSAVSFRSGSVSPAMPGPAWTPAPSVAPASYVFRQVTPMAPAAVPGTLPISSVHRQESWMSSTASVSSARSRVLLASAPTFGTSSSMVNLIGNNNQAPGVGVSTVGMLGAPRPATPVQQALSATVSSMVTASAPMTARGGSSTPLASAPVASFTREVSPLRIRPLTARDAQPAEADMGDSSKQSLRPTSISPPPIRRIVGDASTTPQTESITQDALLDGNELVVAPAGNFQKEGDEVNQRHETAAREGNGFASSSREVYMGEYADGYAAAKACDTKIDTGDVARKRHAGDAKLPIAAIAKTNKAQAVQREEVQHADLRLGTLVSYHVQGKLPSRFSGVIRSVSVVEFSEKEALDARGATGKAPVSLSVENGNPRKQFLGRLAHVSAYPGKVQSLDILVDEGRSALRVEVDLNTNSDPAHTVPNNNRGVSRSPSPPRAVQRKLSRGRLASGDSTISKQLSSRNSRMGAGAASVGGSSTASPTPRRSALNTRSRSASMRSLGGTSSIVTAGEELPIGSPVTFFVEGGAHRQYWGRIRGISADGTFVVDLSNGGRLTGVQAVTPCSEEDVAKDARVGKALLAGMKPIVDDVYSPTPRNHDDVGGSMFGALSSRGVSPRSASSPRRGAPRGFPCKFVIEGNPKVYYGRVRAYDAKADTHVVDLIGGGRKVGVRDLNICTEEELALHSRAQAGLLTGKDPYAVYRYPALPSFRSGGPRSSTPGRSRSMKELEVGCPVLVPIEASLDHVAGWVKSVDKDGSYSIELAGGGRRVGVKVLEPCTPEEVDQFEATRQPLLTSRDDYASLANPNAEEPTLCIGDGGSLSSRSLRSPTPHVNGVAITRIKSPRGLWA